MRKLIAIADSTEVNAFVIDVKDEFGLNIPSQDPMLQKNAGKAGVIPNVRRCSTRSRRTTFWRSRGSWCSRIRSRRA